MLYEVVSGQILLSHRQAFYELHSGFLLPVMRELGIEPVLLLETQIGRYGRFLDVYAYRDFTDYEAKTADLLKHPQMEEYYEKVGKCIQGSIVIELMTALPYAGTFS